MTNSNNKINAGAFILAGGKSSRMGEDKGLMMFKGKMLAEHAIHVLSSLFPRVVIVTGNVKYESLGLEIINDRFNNAGPAGGIHSVLSNSSFEKNFITACDMPFIKSSAVRFIYEQSNYAEITIPVINGRMQPLFAVYDTSCLARWEELTASGLRKLETLVKNFRYKLVDVDSCEFFNEKIFANMNTQADIKKTNGEI